LVTETEDLMLECDATIADRNTLTARLVQLEAQLTQILALTTATTNSSSASRKGQTDPKKFTGQDHGKLRCFVALLCLHLIDRPGEFSNKESQLWYVFSQLEGAMLEQMIHLIKDDGMNLDTFEASVTSLEEEYGDPDHMNTAKQALEKLC
jgi:hypothetical protein